MRIADLGLGQNPIRLTSVRALPDAPGGGSESALDALQHAEHEQMDGAHVTLEVCFAYRARPTGTDLASKVANPQCVPPLVPWVLYMSADDR